MHNILQTNGGGGAKNGGKFNFGHITYVIEFSDAGGTSKEQADIKKYQNVGSVCECMCVCVLSQTNACVYVYSYGFKSTGRIPESARNVPGTYYNI